MYNKQQIIDINLKDKMFPTVLSHMEKYKPNIWEWDNKDLDGFLSSLGITSRNTFMKYVSISKKIHQAICKQINTNVPALEPSYHFTDYIDIHKLRTKNIKDRAEFITVRDLLYFQEGTMKGNYRDVCLFYLAWFGLTAKQIQTLENRDVQIIKENEIITLKITIGNHVVIVNEPDIVEDFKQAKGETHYYKRKVMKHTETIDYLPYEDSQYFIRGIRNGNTKRNMPIESPNKALNKRLSKYKHPKLDLAHLSLEDIRRSRIIYTINNHPNVTASFIANMLGISVESDVAWLLPIAKKLNEIA